MKYMLLLGIDPAIERDKLVSEFTNAKRVALSGREYAITISGSSKNILSR